ncbi:MAG TPA: GspMb/PilO family protein [Sedimentisphaerales bacterium]|nr:GspMb/PilO family protein [Sedimentisphaerales bacterium]
MPRDPREQLSASRRYALTTAPFVIAAAALCNWVVWPHVGYLHAMQRLEPVMGKMAEELDIVAEGLDEKLANMRALRRDLAKVQEGLFTREESKAFLHELQTLVEATGCVMTEANFTRDDEGRKAEDPNSLTIVEASHVDLTAAGSYEQIVSLLGTLQRQRQKVWVDSCRLNLVDPRSGRLHCQLGLTLYALVRPGELTP